MIRLARTILLDATVVAAVVTPPFNAANRSVVRLIDA